jgi:murein DD-endopeptidase MepM/ murein hydrolase activator NlpD
LATALASTLRPLPALATPSPFELVFPQDPTVTEFVDSFGFARAGHRHQGNDLMAPKMTPVHAAGDGTVVSIGDGGTAGRRIVIDHLDDFETWYLHLNNDDPGTDNGSADWTDTVVEGIEEGARIRAGQHIAYVGDSGNAEWVGSHTHFELHHLGAAIDPYPFLVPAYGDALRRAHRLRSAARTGITVVA